MNKKNTSFLLYFLPSSPMISCRVDPIYDFIFSLLSIAYGTLYGPLCSDGKSSSSTTGIVSRPFAYSWLLKILFFHFVSFLSRRFFLSSAGFCRQCLFAGRAAKNSSHIFSKKRSTSADESPFLLFSSVIILYGTRTMNG